MPAFLIGEEGPLAGLLVRFEEGEEWVLGRDPDVAGQVLEDPMVSRRHVICRLTPEGYILENLSAVNPATQNGKVITDPTLLREGDIIQIGSTFFRFSEQEPSSEVAAQTPAFEELPFEEADIAHLESPAHYAEERWMIKVISGPNTGGEFSLEKDKTYILGKDPTVSDIILQDLSVSRQHARLSTDTQGTVFIEDLGSRNGVLVNGELITDKKELVSQDLIALGTTSFLIIDRQETRETIYSPAAITAAIATPPPAEEAAEEIETEEEAAVRQRVQRDWKEMVIPRKHLALAAGFGVIILIILVSILTLFSSKPVSVPEKNPGDVISDALRSFPSVQFSFNPSTGKLFLVGHVLTSVDYQELTYTIQNIPVVHSVEDNVVVDEFVWQNMNALLGTNPDWKGVSIHAPVPGRFVMRGYLETVEQAVALADYMNRQFPYLDRLENQIVIESNLDTQIQGMLIERGYSGVIYQLSNGELVLSGSASEKSTIEFQHLVDTLKGLRGIRSVKNFVVFTSPESSRIDLTTKYQVTGASKKDGISSSIVINGKILSKGDLLDGMMITMIEPNMVLLEKDGSKFKINYNLQ